MTPDEMERIVAIEHEQKDIRVLVENHIQDEEQWRSGHDKKVDEIYDVLVGAKGAAKVLSWIIGALAAAAAGYTWVVSNLHVTVR